MIQLYAQRIETYLEKKLPTGSFINDAMRYATLNGGKRLRAALVYASGETFSVPLSTIDDAAAAVECIHAYSLIHDDLPAMDNDDMRRGKPSCHKAYGEAQAILAGDALNTIAFDYLAQSTLPAKIKIAQILTLTHAAGHAGMIGGQSLDMTNTNQNADYTALEKIHRGKTGALITAALQLGALPAENYNKHKQTLQNIGEKLGLAYQMLDDILDVSANSETLGKTAGKDTKQEKTTIIRLFGLKKSQSILHNLHTEIHNDIKTLPTPNTHLSTLIDNMLQRKH